MSFVRRYKPEEIGMPLYPGAVVGYHEYESPTYYMAERRQDGSSTFPFFVVAVADMGSCRRITPHRLPGYDNVNGEGNVRTSVRFR